MQPKSPLSSRRGANPRVSWIALGLLALAVAPGGCGGDSAGPTRDGFGGVIDEAGDYVNPDSSYTEGAPVPIADSTAADGTIWACTTTHVTVASAPDELFLFNESGRVYPGALLQGATLEKDPPDAILLRRGPGRVAINLTTGEGDSTYIDLPEISPSVVGNAVNDLVRGRTYLPQVLTVDSQNLVSEEQLKLATKLTFSGFGSSGVVDWKFRHDRQYTRRLVTILQKFYDVRFERPFDAADWFDPSVTVEDFRRFAGPGNPPVYIGQVNYGRIVYVLIEAEVSDAEIDLAVQYNYSGLADGSVDTNTSWTGSLNNVQLKAVVYGGSESPALQQLFSSTNAGDFNSAVGKMLTGQDIQTGLPISYIMKDVKNDQTVRVKLATEYDIRECTPIATALTDPLALWEPDDGTMWTTMHPPVTRIGFKILGSQSDEIGHDYNWSRNVCENPDGSNRPCDNPCAPPGLPSNKEWDEGVIRTAATSALLDGGGGNCMEGTDLDNWALVQRIDNQVDTMTFPLTQVDTDAAPTLIDYRRAPSPQDNVIEFHTWPDTIQTSWENLSATDGRYGVRPEYEYGSLRFDGNMLVGKYYTIFMVLQSPNEIYAKNWVCQSAGVCGGSVCWQDCLNVFTNRRGAVLLGSDRANEARIAFDGPGRFSLTHVVGGVTHRLQESNPSANDEAWHVYAVAFGPNGARIFRDGTKVAEDPTMTAPITSFTGAHLGSEPIGGGFTSVVRWKLTEIYEGAGSDAAILTQTQHIQSRLGL